MMNQEVNFAALKQRVTMEAVLRHYQVNDLKGGRSGQYRGRCPIHQGEGCDAFHVDVKRKIFHCFSCGAGGDILDLVALLNRCPLREAALQLQDWFPGGATSGDQPIKQRVTKGKISVNPALPFTLRNVDGSQPRYRFPAGFGKSRVLFNFHRATAISGDTVVVVEGFFDCMRVSQAGFGPVVALLGTELYEHPMELLCKRFSRVVLMLDGDEAGRLARSRVATQLTDRCEVRVVELASSAQPDQLPDSRLRELIDSATGWSRKRVLE